MYQFLNPPEIKPVICAGVVPKIEIERRYNAPVSLNGGKILADANIGHAYVVAHQENERIKRINKLHPSYDFLPPLINCRG